MEEVSNTELVRLFLEQHFVRSILKNVDWTVIAESFIDYAECCVCGYRTPLEDEPENNMGWILWEEKWYCYNCCIEKGESGEWALCHNCLEHFPPAMLIEKKENSIAPRRINATQFCPNCIEVV